MYNGNYPNDYEENQGRTEGQQENAAAADQAAQGDSFGGQEVQGAARDGQDAAYTGQSGAGAQYGHAGGQDASYTGQSSAGAQSGQGAAYTGQGGSGAQRGQDASYTGQYGRGDQDARRAEDGWQSHNYYNDRYRGGQNGHSGGYQNSYNGYQDQGGQGNSWQGQNGGDRERGGYSGYGGSSYGSSGQGGSDPRKPKKKRSKGKIAAAVALAAVFVAFCAGISWMAVSTLQDQITSAAVENAEQEAAPETREEAAAPEKQEIQIPEEDRIASAGSIQGTTGSVTAVVTDVTEVVERVMPASVSITNNYTQQVQDFWGQTYSQDEEASGSGIIIGQNETELLIVTNNHVVDGANELHVQFIDGEVAEAQVKGTDSAVDLAVIAVELDSIQEETKGAICIAEMGDSDSLKIGEPAIAIGNALGYGQSVTTGVISALNRSLEVSETGTSTALIQTDAAINPGNSGGALLNIKGQVIGINSSKIGGSAVEGMGYAVPISTAKPIIEELMTHETKTKISDKDRGYLGISCINVTSDLSENFNMPEGIFVAQVYEGTGADRAGLVRGDIITEFDGVKVTNQEELTKQMSYYKAGETVEITIMQGSPTGYQAKSVQVTLSSYEELNESSQKSQEEAQTQQNNRLLP